MKETTKIQENTNTKVTTIPQIFCKILNLNKGDTIEWTIDIQEGVLHIKKSDDKK